MFIKHHKMNRFLINFIKFFFKSLLFHKYIFPDFYRLIRQRIINTN